MIWASGTPYSLAEYLTDIDDSGNTRLRIVYPTGLRNDQRNGGQWDVSGRIEKGFSIAGRSAEGFFAVDNILKSDDLTLLEDRLPPIVGTVNSQNLKNFNRRFGRRWEMGMSIHF
jgi:hypothetical protein